MLLMASSTHQPTPAPSRFRLLVSHHPSFPHQNMHIHSPAYTPCCS